LSIEQASWSLFNRGKFWPASGRQSADTIGTIFDVLITLKDYLRFMNISVANPKPFVRTAVSLSTAEKPVSALSADTVTLSDPLQGSEWGDRMHRLRSMVPVADNASQAITAEKVQRNREVTALFYDLGMELDKMINGRGPNGGTNWALWAAQASSRAGAFLRGETAVMGIKGAGRNSIHQANGLALGDIGAPTGRFIETFKNDTAPNAEKRQAFLDSLPDEPLRQVFRSYYDAMWETDVKKKQELVLLGNLAYGGREQARMDPFLNAAMEAMPGPDWVMRSMAGGVLGLAGLTLEGFLTDKLRMKWPGFEANLNKDVPKSENPDNVALNQVRDFHALENRELTSILTGWRQTGGKVNADPNSMAGTGAEYWGDLGERMHFISEMVREHLLDPNLYARPS
jgi:hypothetical protein